MAELLRHRQTKEAATDMFTLQPPRHISTLPEASVRCLAAIRPESGVKPTCQDIAQPTRLTVRPEGANYQ